MNETMCLVRQDDLQFLFSHCALRGPAAEMEQFRDIARRVAPLIEGGPGVPPVLTSAIEGGPGVPD